MTKQTTVKNKRTPAAVKQQEYIEFITDRFKGRDVHIVASGPSLFGFDYSYFDTKIVVTVNHAYKLVQHDFVCFIDSLFAKVEAPTVTQDTLCVSRYNTEIDCIQTRKSGRFSLDPADNTYYSNNSGVFALSVVLQGGAERVFLWGFDYRFFNSDDMKKVCEVNGTSKTPPKSLMGHSTSGNFNHSKDEARDAILFDSKIRYFKPFPKDKIYNMSLFSAIPFFEKLDYREVEI